MVPAAKSLQVVGCFIRVLGPQAAALQTAPQLPRIYAI